jgi:hypothetical protein
MYGLDFQQFYDKFGGFTQKSPVKFPHYSSEHNALNVLQM